MNNCATPINTGAGSILSAESISEFMLLSCPQDTSRACIYRCCAIVAGLTEGQGRTESPCRARRARNPREAESQVLAPRRLPCGARNPLLATCALTGAKKTSRKTLRKSLAQRGCVFVHYIKVGFAGFEVGFADIMAGVELQNFRACFSGNGVRHFFV